MATSTVGQYLNFSAVRIQENLNNRIDSTLPMLDPFFRENFVSSQATFKADMLGRDLLVRKTLMGSYTGVVDQGAASGDMALYGDAYTSTLRADKLFTQGSPATLWPDVTESPHIQPYRLVYPMRSMLANLPMTLGMLTADATPAVIGQIVQPHIAGHGKLIAHTLCNYLYLSQNQSYRLFKISTVSVAAADANGVYAITITTDNYAIDRVWTGMRVDILFAGCTTSVSLRRNDTTGTMASQTPSTRVNLVVLRVDEINNQVVLGTLTNPSSFQGGTPVAGDYITHANQRKGAGTFTGIAGFNSFIKGGTGGNDNYILGAEAISTDGDFSGRIDVTVHPEHLSVTQGSVGTLTEHILRKYVHLFNRTRRRYGYFIDFLCAPEPVWTGYESTKIGREIINRTGRVASLADEGSDADFEFKLDGRVVKGYSSNYVDSGTLYGHRMGGNNWVRVVAPTGDGMKKDTGQEAFAPFEWVAGALTGTNTTRVPYRNSTGRLTEMVEMPAWLRMQILADKQLCGLKLTGLSEDRITGNTAVAA